MNNNDTVVIYHGGCRDGFCAAWVVNKAFREHQEEQAAMDDIIPNDPLFFAGFYGQEPPDVKGKHVIIVDFAYDIDIMAKIALDCEKLTWLDHHKTAMPVADMLGMLVNTPETNWKDKIEFNFDLAHSGAGIAWNYFFKQEPRPWIVDYVEDRDLWAKKLNNTDVVNAYVACLEFSFLVWDDAASLDVEDVAEYGQTAIMKTEQYVREVCKNVYFASLIQYCVKIENPTVPDVMFGKIPTVNICQVDCSEVLHKLCEMYPNAPFTLYWFKRQDGLYQYGLRSIGDFDCSVVAKLFGGGGHRNAAGFQLSYLIEELK